MKTFRRNQVLVNDDPGAPDGKRYWRVVWSDLKHAWIIPIAFDRIPAWPEKRLWAELQDFAPTEFRMPPRYLCDDPPHDIAAYDERVGNFLTRRETRIRDERYALIGDLTSNEVLKQIFERGNAGKLVQATGRQLKTGRDRIYEVLKLWMMLGAMPNALIPWTWRSGGPGKEREAGAIKRGRTPDAVVLGHHPERTGINVSESHKELIVQTYIENWRPGATHREMVRKIFEQAPPVGVAGKDGTITSSPPSPGEWLTKGEIRYWIRKRLGLYFIIRRAVTPQTYVLTRRGIGRSARDGIWYPTQRFEIDSTILDLYLVSAQNRANLIGRPIVYFVVDVFSGAIVGFHVALEGPNAAGARAACFNAFSIKEDFLRTLGVLDRGEPNWWPMNEMPDLVTADRGEMLSDSVHKAFARGTTTVEHLPAMRGDLKPFIEILFRLATDTLVRWLPGAVRGRATERAERGRRDWRLDACLTLFELNVLLARFVRFYNAARDASNYAPPEALEDGVSDLTPSSLYQWGLANMDGAPAVLSRAELIPRFLEPVQAKVTRAGLFVGASRYGGDTADREHWSALARHFGRSDIVVYPERTFGREVYWQNPKTHEFETFTRTDDRIRAQATLWDIADDAKYRQLLSGDQEQSRRDREIELHSECSRVVDHAQAAAKAAKKGMSNTAKTAHVATNRADERARLRGTKAAGKHVTRMPEDFDEADVDLLNAILNEQLPRRKTA